MYIQIITILCIHIIYKEAVKQESLKVYMHTYACIVELACAKPTWISTQLRSIEGTTYFWSSHLCTQSQRVWMEKKRIAISNISPAGQVVQEH